MRTQNSLIRFALVWLFGLFSFLLPQAAPAQPQVNQFQFTRIADSWNTFSGPALDDGRIAFWGKNENNEPGIYTGPIEGPFNLVAPYSGTLPGTDLELSRVDYEFGFDAGRVAFSGGNADMSGIYVFDDGAISTIADTSTPIPAATGVFRQFNSPPSVNGGKKVFVGQRTTTFGVPALRGIYLGTEGHLSRIVDTTMAVPGEPGAFTSFMSPIIEDNRIAFVGDWPERDGIYLHNLNTGVLSRIVDNNTEIPGRGEGFRGFSIFGNGLDLDDDHIVFVGEAPPIGGVYLFNTMSGALTTIAETGTPVPGGGTEEFEQYFNTVSIDDGRVAFSYGAGFVYGWPRPPDARSETPFYGVYSNLGGSLARVLDKGDILDGKLVARAYLGRQGLDGDQIAMSVIFDDLSSAVYIATPIPEPATVALLVPAFALLAFLARREWARRRRTTDDTVL